MSESNEKYNQNHEEYSSESSEWPSESNQESIPISASNEEWDGPPDPSEQEIDEQPEPRVPNLCAGPAKKPKQRKTVPAGTKRQAFTPQQRLLVLDTWQRSGLPAKDYAAILGISKHSLYTWKKRFNEQGPAGLEDGPKGAPKGSKLNDATRRAIIMMKQANPEWGCDRIHDMLHRTEGYAASSSAILRVLKEEGYEVQEVPTRKHPDKPRRFERARPNQLWQTDLFTFMLKRQNRRVHLVAFMDDHSRFIVGYGLHGSASGAMVRETFESCIANFGAPLEVLTDNGTQYNTWRGKSAFTKLCEKRGINQIIAKPRRPQTLGKVERFWGTLWRECVEAAIFRDLDDARERLRHFIDYYNFQRTHQGIDGHVPADRFFSAAQEVKETLKKRVEQNALDLAQHGTPRKPFYLTDRVGGATISLHGEGDKVIFTNDGQREEVDLSAPGRRIDSDQGLVSESPTNLLQAVLNSAAPLAEEESLAQQSPEPEYTEQPEDFEEHELPAPGTSPLDAALEQLKHLRQPNNHTFLGHEQEAPSELPRGESE